MRKRNWPHPLWLAILSASVLFMGGCGDTSFLPPDQVEEAQKDTEEAWNSSDTLIVSENSREEKKPGVLIDQNGYTQKEKKTVFFVGEKAGDTFSVVNKETNQTVYTGAIGTKKNGRYSLLGTGDFSKVTENGIYYIETAYLGRSYSFEIKDDCTVKLGKRLEEIIEEKIKSNDGTFLCRVQTMSWLLQNMEFFADSGLTEKPEELVLAETMAGSLMEEYTEKMQTTQNTAGKEKREIVSNEELASYAALMAQLYRNEKKYNAPDSYSYLKQAEIAYANLEKRQRETDFQPVWQYYAAAELFKSTGNSRYNAAVKNYLKQREQETIFEARMTEEQLGEREAYLFGSLAYMTTSFKVDVDLCSTLMDEWLGEAEKIEASYKSSQFKTTADDSRNRVLVDQLFCLTVAEHVIVSQEYVEIMEDGIHYLGGCNEAGKILIGQAGIFDEDNQKDEAADLAGAYLFVINEIIESEAAE